MNKLVVGSIVLLIITFGWEQRSIGEQVRAPRGELRIVDKNPANWSWITFNVFEPLVEIDTDGALVPRLAASWRWLNDRTLEMTLRQGVRFHNGERFDAEIVKRNVEASTQLSHPFHVPEYLQFKSGTHLEIVTPQTIRFHFPAPDGTALAKLSFLHIASRQFLEQIGWSRKQW
jgi:ABC-type transport system substrate-binding protein